MSQVDRDNTEANTGRANAGQADAGQPGAGQGHTGPHSAGHQHHSNGPTGGRATRQRVAVAAALTDAGDFRSAQDLHTLLRQRGESVGLTTVYRTLQSLADAGEVDVLRTDDGEAIYRRCSSGHHHHLLCRSCGATVEVEGPDVEDWAERVARENGYREVSHTVEIFGTCPACAAAGR